MMEALPLTFKKLEKVKVPILLVDQDIEILEKFAKILFDEGYNILKAQTESDALNYITNEPVGIIICNYKLEQTSGIEILKKARQLKPNVIRILLYSKEYPHAAIEGVQIAEVAFFLPTNTDELLFKQTIKTSFEKYLLLNENQVMNDLMLGHHEQLLQAHNKLKAQLLMSKHIHSTMLVGKCPPIPGFEIACTIKSSEEIDSDFLDFFHPFPHVFDIVIGDVMGKGLPASLVGLAVKTQFNRFSDPLTYSLSYTRKITWEEDILAPKEILNSVHEEIVPNLIDLEYFVSLLYGRFNLRKREFSFIDCGFTKPLYYRAKKKKVIPLAGKNFPLGIVNQNEYIPVNIPYEEGDIFIFYSDGVTQSISEGGELYGEQRLIQLFEELAEESPKTILETIKTSVMNFKGKETLENDMAILVIKINHFTHFPAAESHPVKFNSTMTQLLSVRELIRDYCHKAAGDTIILSAELELLVDEVFSNIVKHGYKELAGGAIYINAEYEEDGIAIEIADQGLSFHPELIPHPNLFGDKDTGYGWYLIRQIADKIIYFPKKAEGGWNRLRIFKRYFNKEAQMEITYQIKDNVIVLTLMNEHLDARDIPEFKDKVLDIITSNELENIVFDLHNLQFIDSSGLGSFLSILRLVNIKGGQLKLAEMKKPVNAIFELVSMHKIFESYDTVEQAIKSFKDSKKQHAKE